MSADQQRSTHEGEQDEIGRLRNLGDAVVAVLDDLDNKGFVSKEAKEGLRVAAQRAWVDLP